MHPVPSSALFARHDVRHWFTAGLVIVYIAAFLLLTRTVGSIALAATAPALIVGSLWGLRGGIIAGLLACPMNSVLLFAAGRTDWGPLASPCNVAGAAMAIVLGTAAGHYRSQQRALAQERAARAQAESERNEHDDLCRHIISATHDVVYRLGADGRITDLNPSFSERTGWPAVEMIGRHYSEIIHPDDVPAARQRFAQIVEQGIRPQTASLRVRTRSGVYLTGVFTSAPLRKNGEVVGDIGVVHDITEHTWATEELRHLAYYDPLTGLPNRELFVDRLKQALMQIRRYGTMLAVMLLDLDRFKDINNTLGHRTGDQLLTAVAARLSQGLRDGDTVARLGGDEFMISLPGIRQIPDAVQVLNKLSRLFAQPFSIDGEDLFVTASIGISLFPADGEDAETLMKHADVAMYQAKESGRNTHQFYAHTMQAEALRKLTLENHFRRALEHEEFLLHYQPQLDLATGQVAGVEALVRWSHPVLGLLYPGEFIPIAEETGLIVPLGEWLLQKACLQGRTWQAGGWSSLRMAVNLSMRQFQHGDIGSMVTRALDRTGFEPASLDLEMTESMVMQNADRTIATLRSLKNIGVRLTIDDFGTGYSSLAYLKTMPLSTLKLDRSFVSGIASDPGDQAVSRAVVAMAHNMNLRVIAEGVETQEQLEYLRDLQCDEVQGYLFSRPVPAQDLTRYMVDALI